MAILIIRDLLNSMLGLLGTTEGLVGPGVVVIYNSNVYGHMRLS